MTSSAPRWRRTPPQDLVDRLLARERSAPRAHRGRAAAAGSPTVKPKKELPDPAGVLDEVTTFVELAKDGAYMAGDRRVHHTERSKWRYTFRRLAAEALAALTASDPAPAQQAVAKIIDLACDLKRYDYFHSDDPVEAAKFVVSGGRGGAVGIGTPARRFRGARWPRAGAAHPLGGRLRLDPPGLRSGGAKGNAPGRSACPAAYDARYVADVRRVLPGGAGGSRTRGSQAAAHRVRNLRRDQLLAQGAGGRPRRVARNAPRPVHGHPRGGTAGPARRQPGTRRTGTDLPAREDRGAPR